MPRGLHFNDRDIEPEDHFTPSPGREPSFEPHPSPGPNPSPGLQPMSSGSPSTARQFVDIPIKRTGKFDPTEVITVYIEGNLLEPSNECSQRCTYYFLQMNDAEGVNWKKVPQRTKNFYWGEFKTYILHPGYNEEVIKKAWMTKVAKRYGDWISALSKLAGKPEDERISQANWHAWTRYWKTNEFKEKSNRGKRNRDRNGKGMVNHTGGSQTFKFALQRMHAKNYFPDSAEFHLRTHEYKNRPRIFYDDKARQIHADYSEKTQETLSQLQSEAEVSGLPKPNDLSLADKAVLFKEAAGGEKRSGVYGSGSAVSHFYTLKHGVSFSSGEASSNAQVDELKKEVIELKNLLAHKKEERDKAIKEAVLETEERIYGS